MIVLSGADGALAQAMLPILRDRHQVCAFGMSEGSPGDTQFLSGLFDRVNPRTFLHLARMDDMERCEFAREDAYTQNAFIPGTAAKLCAERGVRFVFLSSACVFGGGQPGAHAEDDPADPDTAFGDSLLLGERLVRESGSGHLILRLPDYYGAGGSWLDGCLDALAQGRAVRAIRGRRISPLSVDSIARTVSVILGEGHEGVLHIASAEGVPAADFLRGFARILGIVRGNDAVPWVEEVPCEEYLSPVEWPMNTVLDAGRLARAAGIPGISWEHSLEEFVKARFSP